MQLFRRFRDAIKDMKIEISEEISDDKYEGAPFPQSLFDQWLRFENRSTRMFFQFQSNQDYFACGSIGQDYFDELVYRTLEDSGASWLPYDKMVFQVVLNQGFSDDPGGPGVNFIYLVREYDTHIRVSAFMYNPRRHDFSHDAEVMFHKDTGEVSGWSNLAHPANDRAQKAVEIAGQLIKSNIFFILAMLDAERILVNSSSMTAAHGTRRKGSKKVLPINEYKILELGLPKHIRDKDIRELGKERACQRFHWRRGHWRYYDKPTLTGKTKTRVKAYSAGDPSLGIIHKEYEVH